MAKKSGVRLGTGLAAIFGDEVNDVLDEINNGANMEKFGGKANVLKISDIRVNPYQPRKVFDQKALEELAESIKIQGVFQPIIVRKSLTGYELVSGERRLRASQLAGKDDIPAVIMDFDDKQMMEIALLENIQREDLNVIEEANGYQQLIKTYSYTQDQLAGRVGKSREHIANTLRLLKLPKEVQQYVEDKKLSMGHVRPLVTLPAAKAKELAEKIVSEGLSVRAVENLVNLDKAVKAEKPTTVKKVDPFIKDLQKTLTSKFASKVKITDNSINISYSGNDDLNRILDILGVIENN